MKDRYDLVEAKIASIERGISEIRNPSEEVSSFWNEVKRFGSPIVLSGCVTELEKLLEEKNQDAHQMEIKSKTSSSIAQCIRIEPEKKMIGQTKEVRGSSRGASHFERPITGPF